jgi:hypothetical protein
MYMAPISHPSEHKRMYLTSWQMREIRDEAVSTKILGDRL